MPGMSGAGPDATLPEAVRARLRELPAVDRLAAAVQAAEAGAVAERDGSRRRPRRARRAPGRAARRARRAAPTCRRARGAPAPVAAPRDQRDRRRRAHEPRAGAAGRRRRARRSPRAAAGYANLELDLDAGARGSRHDHVDGAAARADRRRGGARGQQLRRRDAARGRRARRAGARSSSRAASSSRSAAAFRIPDVIAQAGARLVEVGTTNRTRLADYERRARRATTGAILRAHPSNFRTVGFVEEVAIEALCALGVPVIDDVGSGVLADDLDRRSPTSRPCAARCAPAPRSSASPATSSSAARRPGSWSAARGDRRRCRRHPLARARADRQALARRAGGDAAALPRPRARARASSRCSRCSTPAEPSSRRGRSAWPTRRRRRSSSAAARVGGGALPLLELHGPAVALDPGRAAPTRSRRRCARGDPPVVGADPGGPRAARPAHARPTTEAGGAPRSRAARRDGREPARRSRSAPPATSTTARPRSSRALTGVDTDRLPEEQCARHLDRARLRAPASCRAGAGCPSSTSPATSASCARWSRARPASTSSCWSSRPTTA